MGASYPKCDMAGIEFRISTDAEMRETLNFLSEDFPVAVYTQHYHFETSDQIPFHWHDELQLTWIPEGEIEYNINGDTFTLSGNKLFLINSRQLHRSRITAGDAVTLCMNFTPDVFHPVIADTLVKPFLNEGGFSYLLIPLKTHQITMLRRFTAWKNEPLGYFPIINFLSEVFEGILSDREEQKTAQNNEELAVFQTALNYVHMNYSEQITVRDIAGSVPINKNILTMLFNKYANMPPIKYLNDYRLNTARNMLLNTDKPVSEISQDVGYNHLSHFIKQFREIYGMSPLKFRNKHRTTQ